MKKISKKTKIYSVHASDDALIYPDLDLDGFTAEKTTPNLKYILVSAQRILQSLLFDLKISRITFYKIYYNETLVGMIYLSSANTYRTPFLSPENKEITIYVFPKFRCLGYAKKIISLVTKNSEHTIALIRNENLASAKCFNHSFKFLFFVNQCSGFLGNRYFIKNDDS